MRSRLLEERRELRRENRLGRVDVHNDQERHHMAADETKVSRRYWGDELSSCIELYCMSLSNDADKIDQYIACLAINCPEAIVQMTQPTLYQLPPLIYEESQEQPDD
jgi:hypothetical protein